MSGESKTSNAENQQDCCADFDTEPAGFFDAAIHLRTKAIAADRLKSLTESNDGGVDEHHKTADDRHGSDCCVSVRMSHYIHDDGCNAGDPLTAKGWNTAVDHIFVDT